MKEHDVVPLPREIFGTSAESGWGTSGELLLVSAVKRHGVNKWNLISKELKARAISLNVNPLYFSEVACKQKFDILKGRYASSSSSSRSRIEDLVNDMHWFEELRKLRVSLLKRELEHYDASIGNLQVKIKRLKAEKAPDTSVSTRVKNSFATSQSNEEVCDGSSCKFSVQRRVDKPLEGDYIELHSTVTLGSIRNSQGLTSSQGPSNLQEQVLPDETQFYESPSLQGRLADDLQGMETDEVGNSNKGEHRELVLSRSGCQLVDELADALVKHEAGEVVAHALDKDEVEVGILDLQIGGKLVLKMDVVDQGLGVAHADFGQKGMARTFATSADSMIKLKISKNEGFDYAETETHLREDVVLPILPSSQTLLLSENVGNGEHRHAELNTMTEERVILSNNEVGIGEFGKAQTVEADYRAIPGVGVDKVLLAFPLHLAKVAPAVQLGITVSECPDDVTRSVSSADEVLNLVRNSSRLSEGCHHCEEGVTSTIQDEVISCEQKQLLLEELDLKEDDSAVHALKVLATLGVENGASDGIAMESAITPKETEKMRISAVIPFASFTNSESSVLRDGAVLSEASDPRVLTSSSELLNISDVSKGSPSPMRHIVIALDDPGITTPSSENTVNTPANAEVKSSQLNTTTRSDVNCDTEATGIIEEQCISAQSSKNLDSLEQKDWESPHEIPSAVDLRLQAYGTGLENASVLQGVQADHCFDKASITPVSPKSICKFKNLVLTSTQFVRLDHAAKMTEDNTTNNDKLSCTSERSSRKDLNILVQDSRDSGASYSMQVAENSKTVSDHDSLLISSEDIQVEPGERLDTSEKSDLPVYLGQRSASLVADFEGRQSSDSWMKKFPLTIVPHCLVVAKTVPEVSDRITQIASDLQNASYGSESTVPEIIADMNLEYVKEELSGVDSEVKLKSPLKSNARGLDSRMPSIHEGSDNMQDEYKDGSSDRNREQTQDNRDHMEIAFDKSEARSPMDVPYEMSPSSRRNHKEPRVRGKRFSLVEVFRNLSNHKSAIFFKGRQENPRYSLLIRRHLDLNFVRARLDEGAYSSSSEFFRDLLLIFNNGMVYYTRGSVEFRGAKALFTEATEEMNRIFRVEALLKQGRPATRTREVKDPIAFAAPSIGLASSAKLADTFSPLTSLLDSGSKKRASSRLGIADTPTNSHSECGAPRSASVNVFSDPSPSRAEEAENFQENDQEVNGRLKDTKKSHKGSGASRGKPHREELLEGIVLKNAANKSLGRPQMRDLKGNEALARLPAALTNGTCGETLADPESAKESEPVKGKMRGIGGEIDDDDDFLWRGKSLSKLIDLSATPERGPEVKPFPKSRPIKAARVAFKSHGTASQAVGRPSRSGRKLVTPANKPVRPSGPQAKKRLRSTMCAADLATYADPLAISDHGNAANSLVRRPGECYSGNLYPCFWVSSENVGGGSLGIPVAFISTWSGGWAIWRRLYCTIQGQEVGHGWSRWMATSNPGWLCVQLKGCSEGSFMHVGWP